MFNEEIRRIDDGGGANNDAVRPSDADLVECTDFGLERHFTSTQRVLTAVAQINELLDQLPEGLADVNVLSSGLFEQLLKASDRAQAALASAAARAETQGDWRDDGSRSCPGHLSRRYPLSYSRAKQLCHTGQLLRDVLPATAMGLQTGAIGWDIGIDMARHTTTSQARRDALSELVEEDVSDRASSQGGADTSVTPSMRCEEWLLAKSRALPERQFRWLLKNWAARVDPEADERRLKATAEREYLVLAETLDCYHVEGVLTVEHGKLLTAALKAIIGVPDATDGRSGPQRMAHALVGLARVNLEQHLAATTSGARPHLTVTVPYSTFRTLAAHAGDDQLDALTGSEPATWTDDTGPIPNSLLARLACDSTITRVVFGPSNEVINVGRTRRSVSPAARAAVIARDTRCVYPRCTAPPGLSEIHHVTHWSHGGRSDLDNLALICWRHHQWTHAENLTITRHEGQWLFTTPDGRRIE